MNALSNANIISDDSLQKVRVTPNLPSQEQKSELGVSVDNAPSSENKWYVVRATYMREIKAQFNSSVFGAWLRQPEYGA